LHLICRVPEERVCAKRTDASINKKCRYIKKIIGKEGVFLFMSNILSYLPAGSWKVKKLIIEAVVLKWEKLRFKKQSMFS
jgi:hypothetical protein